MLKATINLNFFANNFPFIAVISKIMLSITFTNKFGSNVQRVCEKLNPT